MTAQKYKEKSFCDIANILETFGKFQIIQYTLICLPAVVATMININFIFVAGDINYRCRINECEESTENSTGLFPSWWPNSTIDRCSSPVLRQGGEQVCTNTSFTEKQTLCTEWIYESNNSVITKLNLACQPWKSNLIGTVHNFGMLVSMIVSGWMTDRFGRKPTLILCVVGGSIGHIKTLATKYYMYVIIEFLEAAFTGGSYAAAMVLLLEISGTRHRLLSGVIYAYACYLGESIFAIIAMLVHYWKTIIHIINGPLIFFLTYIFLVQESPRWQIVNGKLDEAKKSLKRIAENNKINIDYQELATMTDVALKEKFDVKDYEKSKEGFIDIFPSKSILKRVIVIGVCRFTSSFVYYGLMINSVWLPGDKYINFLLSTLMSFPGVLLSLYLMNKYGRKVPLMVGYIFCGAVCIVSAIIPDTYMWSKITLFLLGKAIISACYTGAITYSMELFPTSVRGTLLGLCAFTSQLGAMLAPLTPILNTVSTALPAIFFGGLSILSSVLLCLTPETKDVPLFDTIAQLEERNKSIESHIVKGGPNIDSSMECVVSSI